MHKIIECKIPGDYEKAGTIIRAYSEFLGLDLVFQDFENELKSLESIYGENQGAFFLAQGVENKPLGGIGFRRIDPFYCEMKRLFVFEAYQGKGVGLSLCTKCIERANDLGYKFMRLDTLTRLKKANNLYARLGFYKIDAYRYNPEPDAEFFEVCL